MRAHHWHFLHGGLTLAVVAAVVALVMWNQMPGRADFDKMHAVTVLVSDANGHGSGVLLNDHLVLTAKHVVESDGIETVTLANGKNVAAHAIWASFGNGDFAVLELDDAVIGPYASLSCVEPLPGEVLYAVGNPVSFGTDLVTGIVAGSMKDNKGVRMLTVQMALIPGMSGGPVFNRHGDVIGIVDALLGMNLTFLPVPSGLGLVLPTADFCALQLPRVK